MMRIRRSRTEVDSVAVKLLEAESQRHALARVDALGVIERLRYVDIAVQAARWAETLRVDGVQPGDRVVVVAGLDPVWRTALLGVLQSGGVAIPCPGTTPDDEICAIVEDAGATAIVSASPRRDLANGTGAFVLSAERLGPAATEDDIHHPLPDDVALILYAHDGAKLVSAEHTHLSLLAQADCGEQWLRVSVGERIWCTAAEGSPQSIWVLLAAWRAGAEIVVVDEGFSDEQLLELLDRLRIPAVWFTDDEYRRLASTDAPPWIDLQSIRWVLTEDGDATAATMFQRAFGGEVQRVFGSRETGVVLVPAAAVAEATAPASGDLVGHQAEVEREERRRRDEALERERAEPAERETAQADERRRADERKAEERRRREEEKARARIAKERQKADERRRREEAKERERSERAARETARAEERRRAEELKAQVKAEERRRREEEKERARIERAAADERRRAEEAERAEERRREEEAKQARRKQEEETKRLEKAEQERRRDEAQERTRAERASIGERRRAEDVARADAVHRAGEAAQADRLPADQRGHTKEAEQAALSEQLAREASEPTEPEHVEPDIVSRINQYGIAATDPDTRREPQPSAGPAIPAEVEKRRARE